MVCFEPQRASGAAIRSEEHTSELQSRLHLVCRLLLEKENNPSYINRLSKFPPVRRAGSPAVMTATSGVCDHHLDRLTGLCVDDRVRLSRSDILHARHN